MIGLKQPLRGVLHAGDLERGDKFLTAEITVLLNEAQNLGFKFFVFGFCKITGHPDCALRKTFFHAKSILTKET
jgi:hypothetical protein